MIHRKSRAEADPLRRAADRTRTRRHAAFALACVIAVIAGFLAALAVKTADTRSAQDQAAHRHRSPAGGARSPCLGPGVGTGRAAVDRPAPPRPGRRR